MILLAKWRAARRKPAGVSFIGGLTPRRSPFRHFASRNN